MVSENKLSLGGRINPGSWGRGSSPKETVEDAAEDSSDGRSHDAGGGGPGVRRERGWPTRVRGRGGGRAGVPRREAREGGSEVVVTGVARGVSEGVERRSCVRRVLTERSEDGVADSDSVDLKCEG